ncbi:MAG: holin family protein [Coprobacillaceae bacterium]
MDKLLTIFNSMIAVLATILTYIFGDWDIAVIVLCVFMILDYITGMIYAYITKNISSQLGMKGLMKKFLIVFILIAAVWLERLMNNDTWMFRTLVCYFYIANEGISILENASKLGLPIPKKLQDKLMQLKELENR